jgi:MFS family permease
MVREGMSDSSNDSTVAADMNSSTSSLSDVGRVLILTTAFLGWLCAGIHMSVTSMAMQPAVVGLLSQTGDLDGVRYHALSSSSQPKQADSSARPVLSDADRAQLQEWKALVAKWFSWIQCAFLFGAVVGGLGFGAVGDRFGRTKGMGMAILTYGIMAGAAWFSDRPVMLWVCWFLACTGVGGMWPNGVALVSEAWSGLSRPVAAGIIGTAANIGIFLMSTLATQYAVTPENWRWVMLVAAAPGLLGLFSLLLVPESPRWLAARQQHTAGSGDGPQSGEIFRPPLLWLTLVGIGLATVPIIGGWGSANWMVPWAAEAGEAAHPPNPFLKAQVSQSRALTGIVGSFIGGWLASVVGRRRTYLLTSLAALIVAQFTFWFVHPTDRNFLLWVSALGFFSGIYFGWLPLFLPEMFPTRVRSAGGGVCFNFGRILTAVTVFTTGTLTQVFHGDYARIGRVTSLIFAVGILIIWLAPDTSGNQLDD